MSIIDSGVTDYRQEQMLAKKIIISWMRDPSKIKLEYELRDLSANNHIMEYCRLDIAIPSLSIGIRLNGGSHKSKNRRDKDEIQKYVLEHFADNDTTGQKTNWKIFDFNHETMLGLFGNEYADPPIYPDEKIARQEIVAVLTPEVIHRIIGSVKLSRPKS